MDRDHGERRELSIRGGGEVWGRAGDWCGGSEWDDDHGDDAGAHGRDGERGGDEPGPAEWDVGRGFTYASVAPAMSVSRSALYFGATSGGAIKTSGQTVTVDFAGGVPVAWTATPNNSFIQVTSGSGTGAGAFTVSIMSGSTRPRRR